MAALKLLDGELLIIVTQCSVETALTYGRSLTIADYGKRWAIETSYWIKNHCRIRTTTKNPVLQLLFVALAGIPFSCRRTQISHHHSHLFTYD